MSQASWEHGHTPLFHAQHAARYERQSMIREYENRHDCRLVVFIDEIFPDCIARFEELICDADPEQDLHLMLHSPGGDGESAVRLARQAQSRCRELTVIVPDQAKSAATLLALGAHRLAMGPTSDLGPIDPQLAIEQSGGGRARRVSAREIIRAVEDAEAKVEQRPNTYPIHASLLEDVNALLVEQARSALSRTDELLQEALSSQPDRKDEAIESLTQSLRSPLVEEKSSHSAVFGVEEASKAGLPVEPLAPDEEQWQLIWQLYAKYFHMLTGVHQAIYEGHKASQIIRFTPPSGSAG